MSESLSEVVGQDVNLDAPEAIEAPEQEAPQAEAQQESTEAHEADPPAPRVVPLEALHEERARRKEMAQRLAQLEQSQRERDAILEQRLAALSQANKQTEVSFEENPAEALRRQLDQVQTGQQYTAQQLQQWQQAQQAERVQQQLIGTISQAEQQFVAQAPDYIEAVQFLKSQRAAELQVDGLDEFDAIAQAQKELQQLAFQRAAQGKNPAEVAYKLAKARGYAGKQVSQQTPQEKLAVQQKGVAASRSLGSGGAPQNKLTAETLASMSDEEFADLTKGDNWRKIMGNS